MRRSQPGAGGQLRARGPSQPGDGPDLTGGSSSGAGGPRQEGSATTRTHRESRLRPWPDPIRRTVSPTVVMERDVSRSAWVVVDEPGLARSAGLELGAHGAAVEERDRGQQRPQQEQDNAGERAVDVAEGRA